jgi:ATP-dependent Clp protease protease subunit
MKPFFFARAAANKRGEIYIYEDIGQSWFSEGLTAKNFAEQLKPLGGMPLDIYVNSGGGSVFEGIAIYNQLKRHEAQKIVHIDGIAASIASIIAMAGDEIRIAKNGQVMIHNPSGMVAGTAADLRKSADVLDGIRETMVETYVARTKRKAEEIVAWLDAETWMEGKKAVELGFADMLVAEKEMVPTASLMLEQYKNTPAVLKRITSASNLRIAAMQQRTASYVRAASRATASASRSN